MAGRPGATKSIAGVRSALYVAGVDQPFTNLSPRAVGITLAGSGAASSSDISAGSIYLWPWVSGNQFDRNYNESNFITADTLKYLPATSVNFSMGDPSYIATGDGVPGTSRVRRRCSGSYSFNTQFPVIISDDTWLTTVYSNIIGDFLRNTLNYTTTTNPQPRLATIRMATSQQVTQGDLKLYPCVLEEFNIDATGVGSPGNVPSIKCSMTTRGIFYDTVNGPVSQVIHSFPKDKNLGMSAVSGYTRDGRFLDDKIRNNDPTIGGGRLANIKDCVVILDDTKKEQVINMRLTIRHKLDMQSHSIVSNPYGMDLVNHAHMMYLNQREVSGSFSFLASNTVRGIGGAPGFPINTAAKVPIGNTGSASSLRQGQWSSPLFMSFGPLIFNMPAVYWQPIVQEMTTGSSLVTINFLARSDITGGTEFISTAND